MTVCLEVLLIPFDDARGCIQPKIAKVRQYAPELERKAFLPLHSAARCIHDGVQIPFHTHVIDYPAGAY